MSENLTIKDELKKLVIAQELDAEIFDLKFRLNEIPEKIKEMDAELEKKKVDLNQAETDLKKLQVSKNEKENEMAAKETKIKKHQAELYLIKTNKEYAALQQEINNIKADVSLAEEEILKLFDDIKAAQDKCEVEKKKFAEEKNKGEAEKNAFKTEGDGLNKQLDELTAKRKAVVEGVSKDTLARYERVLVGRGRVALALVTGEFCGQCNIHLRPQIINEAKLKKDIIFCENCARILYAEE